MLFSTRADGFKSCYAKTEIMIVEKKIKEDSPNVFRILVNLIFELFYLKSRIKIKLKIDIKICV